MLQMRTFSGTFIVVATAPLGVVGAVVALLLFNQPFGFVALLGMIGLAGILMRNTITLLFVPAPYAAWFRIGATPASTSA